MKEPVKNIDFDQRIFATSRTAFEPLAIELFFYQYEHNPVYRQYCDLIKVDADLIGTIQQIPFLPISFFKTHDVKTGEFAHEMVFESSGTTGDNTSRHFIKDPELYKESFILGFQRFYGKVTDKCILGLLPSYLERNNSSLVYMVDELIKRSMNSLSGFYLDDLEKLHRTIMHNEILEKPTILIGVTFALLDFAEKFPMKLRHTVVMETGGMKGRREEITRQEVHTILQERLGIGLVHSEYGMTELMSQAYSNGNGIFHCPNWMKVLLRDEDDPLTILGESPQTGVINIIDLANIHTCAFIATDDAGRLYEDGRFEVLGRIDNSDLRGCSLMAV